MADRFGGVILKINSIGSFADKVMKAIGASDWQLREITYSDFKAYRVDQSAGDYHGRKAIWNFIQ